MPRDTPMPLAYVYEHLLAWDLTNLKHKYAHPKSASASDALDKYKSSTEYVRIMEPLNLLECYASIRQELEEFEEQEIAKRFGGFAFKVLDSVPGEDNELFTDICMSATQQEIEDREFFKTTLVVITVPGSGEPVCLGKIHDIGWNKVTRKLDVWIRTRRASWRVDSQWECCYLTNMSTSERELSVLLHFRELYLEIDILVAKCSPFPKGSATAIEQLQSKYKGRLNSSQAQAVYGSMYSRSGFSLIQGPPGTGKTSTIVAIVRELLVTDSKPLMFCAPSNAAVDELTKRLEKHFLDSKLNYKILRIGREEKVDPEVAHLTLDGMMKAFHKMEDDNREEINALALVAKTLGERMDYLYRKKSALFDTLNRLFKSSSPSKQDDIDDTKSELSVVNVSIRELRPELTLTRNNLWNLRNAAKARRDEFVKRILQQTDVFCCTLSGSASADVQNVGRPFRTVIIDEAGQCTEPSALIPLQYQCNKVILVGDPKQLPPTVISTPAGNFNYDQSLFVRMLKAHPEAMHTLDVQYRMHPHISKFPRATFYGNILKDGPGMAEKTARQWHSKEHLPPYRFFNVEGKHKYGDGKSFYNQAEILFAERLFSAVLQCAGRDNKMEVGIVSPYKQQVEKLNYHFGKRFNKETVEDILEIRTVDGFQGREKDIIILSCVRAHPKANTVGFLADLRRMNVAITRAKASLWIIGNAETLVTNEVWQSLIRDAHERNMYSEASDFHMRDKRSVDSLQAAMEGLGLD